MLCPIRVKYNLVARRTKANRDNKEGHIASIPYCNPTTCTRACVSVESRA